RNGIEAGRGTAGGGTRRVVSKAGTKTLSGSAYGFWRPSDLVAANLLTGQKTSQKRKQYGGTIGGPIKQDRTHYFANYEDTNVDDVAVVTSSLGAGPFAAPQTPPPDLPKTNHPFHHRQPFPP